MLRRTIQLSLILAPALLIAALAGISFSGSSQATAAPAAPAAAASAPISPSDLVRNQTAAEIVAYWTADRLAAAKPLDLQVSGDPSAAIGSSSGPDGGPGAVSGWVPQGLAVAQSGGGDTLVSPTSDTEPLHGSYPAPFARWQWAARYLSFPTSTIGKMFFTQLGGNFVCSGAVILPNKVMTAGHCVHRGNNSHTGWSTNILFCPSFDSGQGGVNPNQGCWAGIGSATSGEWFTFGDDPQFDRDYGGFKTAATGTRWATNIHNRTGWLGHAWNFPRDQVFMDWGYPAASPFTGGKIITCASVVWYTYNSGIGPDSNSWGCDATGGTSGGPAILKYGQGNWLNSVNSWRFTARPLELNGPYFDTQVKQFIDFLGTL